VKAFGFFFCPPWAVPLNIQIIYKLQYCTSIFERKKSINMKYSENEVGLVGGSERP